MLYENEKMFLVKYEYFEGNLMEVEVGPLDSVMFGVNRVKSACMCPNTSC